MKGLAGLKYFSKKEDKEFEAWAEEAKEGFPDDLHANFDALLQHPAGKELFRGHLREAEFNRRMNALHSQRQEVEAQAARVEQETLAQEVWYKENLPKNQALVKEKKELIGQLEEARNQLRELGILEEGRGRKAVATMTDDDKATLDELKGQLATANKKLEIVDQLNTNLPTLLERVMDISHTVAKEALPIRPSDVLRLAAKEHIDPAEALNQLASEEREKRSREARDAELAKAREEGRREALKSQVGSPEGRIRPSGAIWSNETQKGASTDRHARIDAAVAAFTELEASGKAS